jgi:hypothetical protein
MALERRTQMSRERSVALVVLAFVTLAVLTTEAAAQITGLTVTPSPAIVGSPVTIKVEAVGCTKVAVYFGDGSSTVSSTGSWPRSFTHTYVNPGTMQPFAQGADTPPSLCDNYHPAVNLIVTVAFRLPDVTELLWELISFLTLPPGGVKISKVQGVVTPGGLVAVTGSGFLPLFNPGTVSLFMPGYAGKLDCSLAWTDQYILCKVPDITGVPDTPASSLYVTTAAGSDSNHWPVSFVATRDIIPVPASAVGVSCSNAAGLDICLSAPPGSFSGFHQNLNPTCNWASTAFGSDQYDLNLKNGWRAHSMITTDVRTNLVQSHVPSGGQTSFKVGWHTQHLCWISYLVRFNIIGPKGVPVQ